MLSVLQSVEESLKEKKHDIDNVEQLAVKIAGTNEECVQLAVGRLHSQWTSLDSKVSRIQV